MMAPVGLMGLSVVTWGFATGLPVAGIVLGVIVEAFRLAPARSVSDVHAARALQVIFMIAIGAFVILVATQRPPHSLYMWLRTLPVLFAPLPLLQVLSGGSLAYAALRHSMRFSGVPEPDARRWDATHGYALCSLAAASTMRSADEWFYIAAFALIAWGIAANTPARRVKGLALLACAGLIGYGVSTGLFRLQAQIEEWGEEFLEDLFTPDPDPFRERTRIGELGRIKLNDRILMRAKPEGPRPMQILLRESAFDFYRSNTWETSSRSVRAVPRDGDAWRLAPTDGTASVVIRRAFPKGDGLLPLPPGATSIRDLEAATVEMSEAKAVRVKGVTGAVAMRISYDEGQDAPASVEVDRDVPEQLRPTLEKIVAAEGMRSASPRETVKAIERFFGTGFGYTLQLSQRGGAGGRTIADFLLTDRKGHCEYFATATVLLLRQAGIPARYAVGYSAQEFSALERAFVVRNRHAHAWALALIDGHWVTVDTTPANWADLEAQGARTPFGAIVDVFSWLWNLAQRAWDAADATELALGALALALLVASPWLARRLPRFRRAASPAAPADRVAEAWRSVEARIGAAGFARDPRETVRAWARRLANDPAARDWHAALAELATLYYATRFDPAAPADAADLLVARARALTIPR